MHGVRQQGQHLRHRRRVHAQPRQRQKEFYGDYLVNAQGEDVVIKVSDASGNYQAACSVTVKRNTADIIFGSAGAGEPLAFSSFAPNCKTSAAACWEALCATSAD